MGSFAENVRFDRPSFDFPVPFDGVLIHTQSRMDILFEITRTY